tara:strand:+ start:293 stop:1162 length:870 start_codon:yes stop_codon:yes gene_type:complete
MTPYFCSHCNYKTSNKSNFNKHLNTQKHFKNLKTCSKVSYDPLSSFEMTKKTTNDHKMTKKTTNDHKMTINHSKLLSCIYCNKTFSTKAHKRRHEIHYCKKKEDKMTEEMKLMDMKYKKKEKFLIDKIELLLTQVSNNYINMNSNNNINQTNNIQINNFGNEDTSYLTDTYKTQLLKTPFSAIPKLIEDIHFNKEKPENRNIMIVNKRDNKVKIHKDGRWVYKDKKKTLQGLMDEKYNILDDHYDVVNEDLDNFSKKRYENFQIKYDENDKCLVETMKNDIDIIIFNNT